MAAPCQPDLTQVECQSAGGDWLGPNSTCGQCGMCGNGVCDASEDCVSCPTDCGACPKGACCNNDTGTCVETPQADCNRPNEMYQGDDSVCDPNPCLQPVGACCNNDAGCIETTEADCNRPNETYQGDGSVCDPNPCPPLTGACCIVDENNVPVDCIDDLTEADCLARSDGRFEGVGISCSDSDVCEQVTIPPPDCCAAGIEMLLPFAILGLGWMRRRYSG